MKTPFAAEAAELVEPLTFRKKSTSICGVITEGCSAGAIAAAVTAVSFVMVINGKSGPNGWSTSVGGIFVSATEVATFATGFGSVMRKGGSIATVAIIVGCV